MKLAELETLFWRSVRFDPAPPEVDDAFVSHGALSGRDRMAIYRSMYWFRLVDVLIDSFPRTVSGMGIPAFTRMASKYIQKHPSENPAIERVGFRLAEFMESFSDESRLLADVARLEWLHLDAFISPNPKGLAAITDIRPELFAVQRLELAPSLRLTELAGGALERWAELEQDHPALAKSLDFSRRVPVAVWRGGFVAQHLSLEGDEARALELALAGAPLAEVCAAFADAPDPAQRAFSVLREWFARQWVAGFSTAGDDSNA